MRILVRSRAVHGRMLPITGEPCSALPTRLDFTAAAEYYIARTLWACAVHQLRSFIPDSADHRQDGVAASRRCTGGLEHQHGVFSVSPAGWLRLCSQCARM